MSNTMKAAVVETPDGDFNLKDVPMPALKPGHVLVEIHASGVNPLDAKIRSAAAGHAQQPLPSILGLDMAGVVVETGPGVTRFKAGDAVYGMTGGVGGHQGALAEYAVVDADLLALKPDNLTMRQAAAIPLVFITAWEGLVDRARVQAGQSVLVHGGAGGVGHMAVQIAVAKGAHVFATERGTRAGYLTALGATPIDFEHDSVEAYVAAHTEGKGFDLVYDTGGGAVLDASFKAVCRFGHVVSCLGWGTHALAPLSFKAATYSGVFTLMPLLTGEGRAHHGEILAEATKLAEAGHLVPRVDPTEFPLSSAGDAHAAMTSRKASGKVVVTIKSH